jgi:hypothetical protein
MAFTFGAFFATIVLTPLWLQTNMNYTATWAGYVMAFQGVLGVAMAPVAAILLSRVDPRFLMSTGLAILAGVTLWRTSFAQNITFWQLALPQLVTGLGMPLFFVPLLGLSIAAVPPRQTASAAGLVNFIRTMSGAFGTALVTTGWDQATTGCARQSRGPRPPAALRVEHTPDARPFGRPGAPAIGQYGAEPGRDARHRPDVSNSRTHHRDGRSRRLALAQTQGRSRPRRRRALICFCGAAFRCFHER